MSESATTTDKIIETEAALAATTWATAPESEHAHSPPPPPPGVDGNVSDPPPPPGVDGVVVEEPTILPLIQESGLEVPAQYLLSTGSETALEAATDPWSPLPSQDDSTAAKPASPSQPTAVGALSASAQFMPPQSGLGAELSEGIENPSDASLATTRYCSLFEPETKMFSCSCQKHFL